MSFDNKEAFSRSIEKIHSAVCDVRNAVKDLGTDRDSIARNRIKRARDVVHQCSERMSSLLCSLEPELNTLKQQFQLAESNFRAADLDALRKEKIAFQYEYESPAENDLSGDSNRHLKESVVCRRPHHLSEFHSEEAVQREKLRNIEEIESDVVDLNATYQEFNLLLSQQQEGLTAICTNVEESDKLIPGSRGQLQQSLKYQKSCKVPCTLIAILVITVVIVSIAALLLHL